ncbi:MAG: peroxiredoxin [Thermoplasmata archaeon]
MAGGSLNIIMSTGTVDKLINMGVLVQTAANLGVPVRIFVTATAVPAFKKDGYKAANVVPYGFNSVINEIATGLQKLKSGDWHEMLKTAREIGEVKVYLCSLMAGAMNLKKSDLDPMVDDIIGAAAFMQSASDGQVMFI